MIGWMACEGDVIPVDQFVSIQKSVISGWSGQLLAFSTQLSDPFPRGVC